MSAFALFGATPVFTNDAVILGLLMVVLALVFYTSSLDTPGWKKFYRIVPSLLLCYFLPALLYWPLGMIAPHWFDAGVYEMLAGRGIDLTPLTDLSYDELKKAMASLGVSASEYQAYEGHTNLYYVASRYLLPASLILLCLGIDCKGVINLGPKALIMFLAATLGIIIGVPIPLLVAAYFMPDT